MKLVTEYMRRLAETAVNFNPHEREARDGVLRQGVDNQSILIHTSVKLVTLRVNSLLICRAF